MKSKFYVEKVLDENIYRRIIKASNFEEHDRVPIWDYLDNRFIYDYFSKDEPDYHNGMIKIYHKLEIDLCRGFGASYRQDREGEEIKGANDKIAQKISGLTCWAVDKQIKKIEDLYTYDVREVTQEDIEKNVENTRKEIENFAPHTMYVPGCACGFHATYDLMGQQLFSYAIYDAPQEIKRIMWKINKNFIKITEALVKARFAPLFFIGDDIAYKNGLMFSDKFLRDTFIPCLKNLTDIIHDAGMKVIFHSDGNVMKILDAMLEAGVDGLNPIEPLAGMDIGYLKKKYYGKLILVGNVDCSQTLPLGSKEDVIKATLECIKQASAGGGHFIGSSSEMTPSTPVENILAFYRTIHKYGKYPISIKDD